MIKPKSIRSLSISLWVFALLFVSCEEDVEFNESNTTSVVYEFYDSSVPPEYHRSYEIELNIKASTVKVTVDSYGDILHDKTLDYSVSQSTELFKKLNEINPNCTINEPEPCSGGTGERLIVVTTDKKYDLYLDHCGDNDFPTSCGGVKSLIDFIKSLIPDLATLLQ